MNLPIKAFEINGFQNEFIRLEILKVFGYPEETSFRGGYDICCRLEIKSGNYMVSTENYYSSTGALYAFYQSLNEGVSSLNGKCSYGVYCPENDLRFEIIFDSGKATVGGSYRDDPMRDDILYFQFDTDQSYFSESLSDLKKTVRTFGDKDGIKGARI